MRIDTKKLKRAVLAYEDSVQNFSKDKIKADLKEIFKQFNINPSDFFTVNTNTGQKGEVSVSNYIDKLSDKIYKNHKKKIMKALKIRNKTPTPSKSHQKTLLTKTRAKNAQINTSHLHLQERS